MKNGICCSPVDLTEGACASYIKNGVQVGTTDTREQLKGFRYPSEASEIIQTYSVFNKGGFF